MLGLTASMTHSCAFAASLGVQFSRIHCSFMVGFNTMEGVVSNYMAENGGTHPLQSHRCVNAGT